MVAGFASRNIFIIRTERKSLGSPINEKQKVSLSYPICFLSANVIWITLVFNVITEQLVQNR